MMKRKPQASGEFLDQAFGDERGGSVYGLIEMEHER